MIEPTKVGRIIAPRKPKPVSREEEAKQPPPVGQKEKLPDEEADKRVGRRIDDRA